MGKVTPADIIRAREVLGLSQEALAKELGIADGSVGTVSRWENGHRDPNRSQYGHQLAALVDRAHKLTGRRKC